MQLRRMRARYQTSVRLHTCHPVQWLSAGRELPLSCVCAPTLVQPRWWCPLGC